jgi:hypothetical protein
LEAVVKRPTSLVRRAGLPTPIVAESRYAITGTSKRN